MRLDRAVPEAPGVTSQTNPGPATGQRGSAGQSAGHIAAAGGRDSGAADGPRLPGEPHTRIEGQVASDVAHDLLSLLLIIDSNVELLDTEELSPGGAEAIRSIRAGASCLRGLARELRAFGPGGRGNPAPPRTRLNDWWPDTGVLVHAVLGESVCLHADVPARLPDVRISPDHLTQVLLNLAANAAHALAESSPTRPASAVGGIAERVPKVAIAARPVRSGDAVILTIADNGAGMTPEVMARACEPFFTTRSGRGGTGLGLAMVRRLVEDEGGSVRLCSTPGEGTTVAVELPTLSG